MENYVQESPHIVELILFPNILKPLIANLVIYVAKFVHVT